MGHDHHRDKQLYRLALTAAADRFVKRAAVDDLPVGIVEFLRRRIQEVILRNRLVHLKNREAVLHGCVYELAVIDQLLNRCRRHLLDLRIFLQQAADAAVEIVANQRLNVICCLGHANMLIIQLHQRKGMTVLVVNNHPALHALEDIRNLYDPLGRASDP
ncbi:hypothetical protein D3C76_1314450 [compost metagenome]